MPRDPGGRATAFTALRRRLARLWGVRLDGVAIVTNPRLRTTRARYKATANRIELAATASADTAATRRVLIHELAHAAAVERHGRRVRPHGREWQALVAGAEAAGLLKGNTKAVTTAAREETGLGTGTHRPRPTRRYAHTCPVCHFSRIAKRKVPNWHCPDCLASGLPGTLAIEPRP